MENDCQIGTKIFCIFCVGTLKIQFNLDGDRIVEKIKNENTLQL